MQQSLEAAVEILQEILDEVTLEYFAAPRSDRSHAAGSRMCAIGQLLYDEPRDFLHISLWERLIALYPEVARDEDKVLKLVRPKARDFAASIHSETTWQEFEAGVETLAPKSGDLQTF